MYNYSLLFGIAGLILGLSYLDAASDSNTLIDQIGLEESGTGSQTHAFSKYRNPQLGIEMEIPVTWKFSFKLFMDFIPNEFRELIPSPNVDFLVYFSPSGEFLPESVSIYTAKTTIITENFSSALEQLSRNRIEYLESLSSTSPAKGDTPNFTYSTNESLSDNPAVQIKYLSNFCDGCPRPLILEYWTLDNGRIFAIQYMDALNEGFSDNLPLVYKMVTTFNTTK
jgi:hypothetical protein